NKHEHDNILNISICRSLARYEQKNELIDTRFKDNLPDRNLHKNRRNVSEHIPTYSSVRSKASNNFDLYMKNYKRRYGKKKGLSKLDCYCEKKVFDKILYIKKLSENVHNDKKRFKKIFLKKYGIGLIFFALIPALGFIYYILFGIKYWKLKGVFPFCDNDQHNESNKDDCPKWHEFELEHQMHYMWLFNAIFSFTMIAIIYTFLIYIIIKFIKYEKLKSGKGK
ncbi:hypothetical protein PVIIG_05853, partial [Plasmodium vivax India VII]